MSKFSPIPAEESACQAEVDRPTAGRGTISQVNRLPEAEKRALYASLIPPPLLTRFHIDPVTLRNAAGEDVFRCHGLPGSPNVRLELRHQAEFPDPVFLLEMTDTAFDDLQILFLNINNPLAPRFGIDRDAAGHDTAFGTLVRNIPEEIRAMQAGLAPGQIRRGLRLFRVFLRQAQRFCARLGIQRVKAEPLAYHNAIMHEFYGFRYLTGRALMERIDQEFAPGGVLFKRLNGSTPFRQPACAFSIKGRSWAIHDGILAEPWECPKMYYLIDETGDRMYDEFTYSTLRQILPWREDG